MTAICYPDCQATSPNGRFALDARSPHNGTIRHRNGRRASENEFGYKYRQHQNEFRYQLLDYGRRHLVRRVLGRSGPRVVWERWQGRGEDSPHELVVSDDGWAVVRTHGFRPEVIAVTPGGEDAVRVRICGPGSEHRGPAPAPPVFQWAPEHLQSSTAGLYWSAHSWRYFARIGSDPFFVWRASWGQRLVIDLGRRTVPGSGGPLEPGLESALMAAEAGGVTAFLAGLSRRMDDVRALVLRWRRDELGDDPDPLLEAVSQATAALQLVGVHRLSECLPFLREWEDIDLPGMACGSEAMSREWWTEHQHFRPVVHHALRLLGEEPRGFPTYHLIQFGDDMRSRRRYPAPERLPDRPARATRLRTTMTAGDVLELVGSPDFIRRRSRPEGAHFRWSEDWEYDFRSGPGWVTLRITWEEERGEGGIVGIEEVAPYWLSSEKREAEYLRE